MRPQTHIYNFGFPSWGPAQVLLQMRNGDVLDEVKESAGRGDLYVYHRPHAAHSATRGKPN